MAMIRVADCAPTPGTRFRKDGPYSGEEFREDVLKPALEEARRTGEKLTVVLDGVPGYGSSFLEEAFGGLVRKGSFSKRDLGQLLSVAAETPLFKPYEGLVRRYIDDARSPTIAA